MKKVFSIVLILVCWLTCFHAFAGNNDYLIVGMKHADGVTIDGIPVSAVKYFSKKSVISWGKDDEASLKIIEVSTSKPYILSKRQFESKGRIRTLEDLFLRTSKTSTRDGGHEAIVNIKRCNDRFAFKERRIALVIGNTAYTYLSSLQNPQSDAIAVTNKLLKLGFDVVETFDCDIYEFRSVLTQFERIANGYQVVLFYYAGHGIQKDGKNYLVPVSERLQKPADINNCVGCDDILRSLEGTSCNSRIVIFDACRSFSSALSDGNQKGLAQIQQLAPGTMLIYSTGFGQVASDGTGDHSPFAQALLNNIGKPGVNFELEIKNVAKETYRLTANSQYPAISGTLTENFVMQPQTATYNYNVQVPSVTNTSNPNAQLLVEQGKRACKTFNYTLAYKNFHEAASMNDMEGCYQLGLLYSNDNFDNANFDDAVIWFTKAADMGHTDAMYQLGELYMGRDNAVAKQWLRKAADKGHAKAADRLNRMR